MDALPLSSLAMFLQSGLYNPLDSLKMIIVHQGMLQFSILEEKPRDLYVLDQIFTSSSSTRWAHVNLNCLQQDLFVSKY